MDLQLFIIRLKKILFLLLNRKYLNIYLKFNTCPSVEHKHVISSLFFNNLIDVGANNGQFSLLTNYLFPQKKIIAFEPLKQCCDKYNLIFSANKNIKCINVGLGSKKSTLKINITQSSDSSSFLRPNRVGSIFNEAIVLASQNVNVLTGSTMLSIFDLKGSLLKIDVQGYELEVLKGFNYKIKYIKYIFIELSHIELYRNQPLFDEVLRYLEMRDFVPTTVSNQIFSSDRLIQADYLLINRKYIEN